MAYCTCVVSCLQIAYTTVRWECKQLIITCQPLKKRHTSEVFLSSSPIVLCIPGQVNVQSLVLIRRSGTCKGSWSRSSADQLLLFHRTSSSSPPALFDFPSTCRSVCFPPCILRLMYGGWEVICLYDHLNLCATSSTSGEMLISAMIFTHIFFLLTQTFCHGDGTAA